MSDGRPESCVDGNYLVIPTKTALPRRCIITNQPVSDDCYTAWDLPFVHSWIIFFLFGPWMLLFSPLLVKRRCKLKAAVSARIRRKYLWFKIALLLVGISPLALLALAVDLRSEDMLLSLAVPGAIVIYVAAFAFVYHTTPMKVVKFKDELYWIRGCSTEFLDSLGA